MRFLKAEVKIVEDDDAIRVTGPYAEMKDIYPKLKAGKFKYSPSDRSWYVDKKKFRGDLNKARELAMGLVSDAGDRSRKETEDDSKAAGSLVSRCSSFRHVSVKRSGARGIEVSSAPYKWFGDKFYKLGGKWRSGSFVFDRVSDPDGVYDAISEYERELDGRLAKVREYDGKTVGVAPYSASFSVDGDRLLVRSSDRALRDSILRAFPEAKWSSPDWSVDVISISDMDSSVKTVRDSCDRLGADRLDRMIDEEARRKSGHMTIRYCTAWSHVRMDAFKPGSLVRNKWGDSPEYLKVKSVKFDGRYEGSDYFFKVEYEPAGEAETEERKRGVAEANAKADAEKRIMEIAGEVMRRGRRPDSLSPKGRPRMSDKSRGQLHVGGGEWFQIDGSRIFFVRNNGGDGDDWSRNNVFTGGAGAIGWSLDDASLAGRLEELFRQAGWR